MDHSLPMDYQVQASLLAPGTSGRIGTPVRVIVFVSVSVSVSVRYEPCVSLTTRPLSQRSVKACMSS